MVNSFIAYLSRRETHVPPPIIAAIVAGSVSLFLILGLMWCYLRRRRKQTRKLKMIAAPYEKSTSPISFPSLAQPRPPLPPQTKLPSSSPEQLPPQNYAQILTALQTTRRASMIAKSRRKQDKQPSLLQARDALSNHPHAQRRPHLYVTNGLSSSASSIRSSLPTKLPSQTRPLHRGLSVRSADSASVYSAASAPLDFHDRVFQSWPLDAVPASPTAPWPVAPDEGYIWPTVNDSPTAIREELMRETHMNPKLRWKLNTDLPTDSVNLEREGKSSTVSATIPTPPSPAALSPRSSHYRSLPQLQRSAASIDDSTSFLYLNDSKPELPPRSPLRSLQK